MECVLIRSDQQFPDELSHGFFSYNFKRKQMYHSSYTGLRRDLKDYYTDL